MLPGSRCLASCAVPVVFFPVLLAVASAAAAQAPGSTGAPATARGAPGDVAELEAFVDGVMAAHLEDHGVAGAVVAVVRDGTLFWSKGYGFADADRRVPVDPATTLFRIGSTTKPFTWMAVLQLRDAGLVDLDADVNDYLDFRIPTTFDDPITLRHLMTHTPGFEDRVFGLFGSKGGVPRGEWLRDNIPARVRPPGTKPSYSNYGSALAGYVVERVSGMSWEAYLEERILEPLGMTYATGREPVPGALAAHMSAGFGHEEGRFVAKPFEHMDVMAPAGSISASAQAMATFMAAQLQPTQLPGAELQGAEAGVGGILGPGTLREMQARAVAPDPRVNGVTLGLYEQSSHGLRIVGHGGGTQWFFTDMALIPDEGLGVFVSYNSAGGALLAIDRFMRAFLNRYYPVPRVGLEGPPAGWSDRAGRYEGRYQALRRSHTTFEKLLGLMWQVRVDVVAPGEILVQTAMLDDERLLEVEPGLFRSEDGVVAAAFREDDAGRTHLHLSTLPTTAAEKAGLATSPGFHLLLLVFWLATFLSIFIVLPGRWVAQRKVATVAPLHGLERWLRWAAVAVAVLALVFLVTLAGATEDIEAFMSGAAEDGIRLALAFPILALLPGLAVVAGAVLAFRRRLWGPWGRGYFAAFAVAVVVFLGQLHYWNLLGWRF
jgi:CubicO group peptidase (beta-lactamase class C family)